MDPDRLAELEEERRFLLRSLRDLDAEHDAGDVDDADYATLCDGYTARTAAVLRAIDEGRAARPARPRGNWGRRLLLVATVVAVGAGAGWMVARSSGQRLGGDEITGGAPRDDIATRLARARAAMFTDPVGAIDLYAEVLAIRPDDPESLAYTGWLLYTLAAGAGEEARATAIADATNRLEDAVAADPDYPDAHCFLAVVLGNTPDGDVDRARAEVDECLAHDPPSDVRALVEE